MTNHPRRATRKSMTLWSTVELFHIEAQGFSIDIHQGRSDDKGRAVTTIVVQADGDRYPGEDEWWLEGDSERDGGRGWKATNVRVIRTKEAE